MDTVLKHRGREIDGAALTQIRELITTHPAASRRELSRLLCQAWDWRQANGSLRDMVCRSLMLALHRAGEIELPPVRFNTRNPLASRARPERVSIDATPIRCALRDLPPLEIRQVRRTAEEPLLRSLLEEHHYLGYTQPVGEHLKYLVAAGDRPVACFTWSSAPRRPPSQRARAPVAVRLTRRRIPSPRRPPPRACRAPRRSRRHARA